MLCFLCNFSSLHHKSHSSDSNVREVILTMQEREPCRPPSLNVCVDRGGEWVVQTRLRGQPQSGWWAGLLIVLFLVLLTSSILFTSFRGKPDYCPHGCLQQTWKSGGSWWRGKTCWNSGPRLCSVFAVVLPQLTSSRSRRTSETLGTNQLKAGCLAPLERGCPMLWNSTPNSSVLEEIFNDLVKWLS